MSDIPGFGQPPAADDSPPDADDAAAEAEEGQDPQEGAGAAHEATQGADVAGTESAADRKARLQKELDEVQAEVDAENAERLANAPDEDKCPTCGQLPPPADPPIGAREIWCPDCGQKLANLPAGH